MQAVTPTTRAAIRAEVTHIVRHPGDLLLSVASSAAIVLFLWYVVPRSWFFTFTGPEGLPYALAGWMYTDAFVTNVLTSDPERALAAIDDPAELTALLRAKVLAVWLIIGPLCTVIAVAIALTQHTHWRFAIEVILAVAVVPFGALAVSGLVGLMYPYHQHSLRWRWRNRRRFRQVIIRWGLLIAMPNLIFPLAFALIVVAPVAIWKLTNRQGWDTAQTDTEFALCALLAVLVTAAIWYSAHRFGVWWVSRHRDRLREYLLDVERG